ncbi:hypothetical protein AB0H83_22225 [Dactylosporangium sp. NPDC050688]|uniref:hypothetical protein n=1 Tax=Dactylosporangium sp. NPDC050688 TaxID=3157217 RepID=UPI00340F219F
MGITRRVEFVATSYADELSIRSLAEISAITADQNVRIIGGQMAARLATLIAALIARPVREAPSA